MPEDLPVRHYGAGHESPDVPIPLAVRLHGRGEVHAMSDNGGGYPVPEQFAKVMRRLFEGDTYLAKFVVFTYPSVEPTINHMGARWNRLARRYASKHEPDWLERKAFIDAILEEANRHG
jgi:hypothetical protein